MLCRTSGLLQRRLGHRKGKRQSTTSEAASIDSELKVLGQKFE